METADPPNSIYHVQSIHMYPLRPVKPQQAPPFPLLVGEMVQQSGRAVDGEIFVTNYRLFMRTQSNHYHIPLGAIECIEIKELFYLQLFCKDARTFKCTFENNESALEWHEHISKAIEPPHQLELLFAFYHFVWAKERGGFDVDARIETERRFSYDKDIFESEMTRMEFQGHSWRITKANDNYKICPTYPPYLLVPSCINDEMLESVAKFRSSRRIPAAVWRHRGNGAVIARCSQPEVGWFGWRSSEDEDLLKAISDACNFDSHMTHSGSDKSSTLSQSPGSINSAESLQIPNGGGNQPDKKLLIMDARSYTTAVANRARGGGCECPEYYPNCEIQFMNLANIHTIRKSFHSLRQLCMSSAEQPNWFSLLEGTRWLQHMSGLMKAAVILVTAVDRDARPVLVHCSDGWDRTPQIVALAELLLDPYYRTMEGFRVLVEREWLAFGHKFADRCGHSGGSEDLNERCPVFLQWLDCVHQVVTQYPVSFEFSQNYLIKLAQHTYSNLYGNFLCNTHKQRTKVVRDRTFSVWGFLNSTQFKNHLYVNSGAPIRVLWPKTNVRDLRLWSEIYLDLIETDLNVKEDVSGTCLGPPNLNMSKTRSYGDLYNGDLCHNLYGSRRSSDPSINRELKLVPHVDIIDDDIDKNAPDFQPSDLEDNVDDSTTRDCLFNLSDDHIDGLSGSDFGEQNFLNDKNNLNENYDLYSTQNNIVPVQDPKIELQKSVETSTETLVSDQPVPSSSPKEYNGFEKIGHDDHIDGLIDCTVCVSPLEQNSREDNALLFKYVGRGNVSQLGEDGLVPVRSPVQERLDQLVEEFRRKLELLEKELHASRQVLIKQACHKCLNGDSEKQDDGASTAESGNGTNEDRASAGESLRSDLSWVDVEDGVVSECQGTLWVPDHAVSRCTDCGTEFWLGRRRHHCRKCGRIFCADCSEHATPLPSEQLYNPVRVCTGCYSELKTSSSMVLSDRFVTLGEHCKRESSTSHNEQRLHAHQLTASTN